MLSTSHLLRHPQAIAAVAGGVAALAGVGLMLMLRKQPTSAEREERRRQRLATTGRIIDGTLIDTTPEESGPPDSPPHALIYRYRIGGVTYECGQDVSTLTEHLPPLGPDIALLGTPVQVRYDRDNPADSIIVAETWNGLWNKDQTHSDPHH